jgi:hypothetical protein
MCRRALIDSREGARGGPTAKESFAARQGVRTSYRSSFCSRQPVPTNRAGFSCRCFVHLHNDRVPHLAGAHHSPERQVAVGSVAGGSSWLALSIPIPPSCSCK